MLKNDNSNRLTKFVVKSVETQPLYYSDQSKNIYILVVDVIESTFKKQIYTKGLKNPIKVSGFSPAKELQSERFNDDQNVGYLQLDSMKINKLVKD